MFGVAFGIGNQLSLGWGNLRTKNFLSYKSYTKKMVYQKRKEKDEK